jgi:Fe-S-cluster-containing dehydrogenase component/formate-dependent nitrite reductase membrane component NrfD
MKFGFIIDNRKCIGCHACTTACKSEHQVPVGVNRTWVKQVEKGEFPDTRRLFSVMRCNHCTDAPCVEICPVEALYTREDGIVDFNNDRCIGCKSCMQACPYDALYIDPENHTAAKCNYCAHRVDIGLEPACVNVCPEHAIISGDMDNPNSEIAQLLSRQSVKVRKAEKGTSPNLFYIDGDEASLNPSYTEKSDSYFWSSQATGVGHYAKQAEKLAYSNPDVIHALQEQQNNQIGNKDRDDNLKSIDILLGKGHRTYDVADKGILWGWEVSGYVLTKAISAGAFLVPFIGWLFAGRPMPGAFAWSVIIGLVFLAFTGALLVKDLDRPDRFMNVLFRPQWKSWLVKGGYSISIYGALLTLLGVALFFEWNVIIPIIKYVTAVVAIVVAIYTAFLFAQAKGRDFWQSPTLAIHMLVHSILAGAATFAIIMFFTEYSKGGSQLLVNIMLAGIGINLLTILFEMATTHPTVDAKKTVKMILKGRYKNIFWLGAILVGNILPFILLVAGIGNPLMVGIAGILILLGIYFTEKIWVEAPQRIPLS